MKRKTWLASILFALAVMMFLPTDAQAAWKVENGTHVYYNTAGTQLTSQWFDSINAGFVKIGKYLYCYEADGSLKKGWVKAGDDIYYFNKSGRMLTSKWISSNGNRYYASKTGKLYRDCTVKIGAYYYGFKDNGVMLRGKQTLNGKTYYFRKNNGRMVRKAFVKIDGRKYYFNASGVLGKKVWINKYYINSEGYIATNTWVGSKYVGSDGHPVKGLQEIDGTYYYFNTSTYKKVTSTSKTINGVTYEFDASGKGSVKESVKNNGAPKTSESVQSTYYSDPLVTDEVLLAAIIYCEAGNQPYYGQVGVGMVITNRMKSASFPSKLREVVYQTVQFSPTFDGALTRVLKNQSLIPDNCKKAAQEVMSQYQAGTYNIEVNGKKVSLKNYLFFMTKPAYVRLKLTSKYQQLGDHVFFKTWSYA